MLRSPEDLADVRRQSLGARRAHATPTTPSVARSATGSALAVYERDGEALTVDVFVDARRGRRRRLGDVRGRRPRPTALTVYTPPMAGNPLTDPNWAADLADTVERVVGTVRERATTPVVHVTRGVVFGLLGAFLGVTALVLLLIAVDAGVAGAARPARQPAAGRVPQLPHHRRNPLPRRCVGAEEAPRRVAEVFVA